MNPLFKLQAVRTLHLVLVSAVLCLSLYGLDPAHMTAIWLRVLLLVSLVTLVFWWRMERMSPADVDPGAFLSLTIFAITLAAIYWQNDASHHYPARQFLSQMCLYAAFFVTLLPIVRRPAFAQHFVSFASILGMLVALFGIGYRFTGTWDLLGRHRSEIERGSFGFFYYENTFGAFAALLVPLTASLLYYRYKRHASGEGPLGDRIRVFFVGAFSSGILFLMASLFTMGVGLVASNSRASLLVLAVLYFLVAVLIVPGKTKLMVVVMIAVCVSGFALLTSSKLLETTLTGLTWDRIFADAQTRLDLMGMSLDLLRDRPWTGWGMGSYPYVSGLRLTLDGAGAASSLYQFNHAHGSFLDLLVEGGGVFTALLVAAAVIIPVRAAGWPLRDASMFRKLMRWQGLLALISLAPMLLSDSHLRVPAVVFLLLVQMATINATLKPYVYHDDPRPPLRNATALWSRLVVWAGLFALAFILLADLQHNFKKSSLLNAWIPVQQKIEQLKRLEPDNPEIYADESLWSYRKAAQSKDPEERKALYLASAFAMKEAVRHAPYNPNYYYLQAVSLALAGSVEECMDVLERSIEYAPQNLKYKTDLMMVCIFEARTTDSILKRRRLNLRARQLYHQVRSDPRYPGSGFERVNSFVGLKMSKEQKEYFKDFIRLADKYNDEIRGAEAS